MVKGGLKDGVSMVHYANICPNCFQQGFRQGVCPGCGFREIYHRHSERTIAAGTLLHSRYITGLVLGEGGFGITYKARDLKTGGIRAIKEYAPADISRRYENGLTMGAASGKKAVSYQKGMRRFSEEARILQELGKVRGIVQVFDFFQENNTAYFVMELLEGAELEKIVRTVGRLSFKDATAVIAQVGLAMEQVHREAHILHRDISPDNIYVSRGRSVKLFDFGSARQVIRELDQQYSVVLKLKYAPPEQHGTVIPQGPYTDVYSLAATYYYCLTGRNLPAAMDRMAGEDYITLERMNIGVPREVSEAVDRALMLDHRRRTQTMAEFVRGITKSSAKLQASDIQSAKKLHILPYIEQLSGDDAGTRWNLPVNQELKIGRSQTAANIPLRGFSEISRIHCIIYYEAKRDLFYVKDVSLRGTVYRGKRLEKGRFYEIRPRNSIVLAERCAVRLGTIVERK